MTAAVAIRLVFRSAASRTSAAARFVAGSAKAKPRGSLFCSSCTKPISPRILRSPVELSCCVESLVPYHSATASALLTSMLGVSHYGWTVEGFHKTR